jgi:hypothetical protein
MNELKSNLLSIANFFKINKDKIILLCVMAWTLGAILAYIAKGNYEVAIPWCCVEYMYLQDFRLMVKNN